MGLTHFFATATNKETGRPLDGVIVELLVAGVPQTLYSDRSLTPKPQMVTGLGFDPITGVNFYPEQGFGEANCYVEEGNYDIRYTFNGEVIDNQPDFPVFGATPVASEIIVTLATTPAKPRTLTDKLGDFVNILDFYQATDPDMTNAFERAMYEAFPDQDSIEIYVPPGEYFLSRQLIPRRTVTLRGAGSTVTRLRFNNVASINATMKGAISLGLETTLTAYTTNPEGYPVRPNNITAGGADQSQITDLAIIIQGTRPAGFDYGIWNAARLTATNVLLFGCGLKTISGTLIIGSGSVIGNANTSLYQNVNSQFATEYGFVTDGTDSNNITFDRCSAFVPAIIGFYEGSQFGNAYRACHREGVVGTTTHGYRSVNPGGSNRSSFTDCYNEGDACTVARWDIASGSGIMQWQGALPEALGSGKNTWFASANLGGWTTAGQVNSAADGDGFTLGSASVAATRMANDGFFVRAGDGTLGSIFRGGDGTYLARNGAAVMKLELGAAIASPTGGATIDAEARTAINAILATMRAFRPTIAT